MSHYPNKKYSYESAYLNQPVAFDVGKDTKDSYSIDIHYRHEIETDVITASASVVKNSTYSEEPVDKTKVIEGRKYKKELFKGTVKECYTYIDNVVKTQGHWDKDPNHTFKTLFTEPIV